MMDDCDDRQEDEWPNDDEANDILLAMQQLTIRMEQGVGMPECFLF